ncbi:hypothetical protein GCM10011611_10960 [Aliidongia dinghuensis]|uniref:Uncharacterized protein n=1 Tax=Aliidongia dinghuensis TaxID=1867774 RepID=A0A8J3E3K6_9PROT|nr:hypothetical protein [Aliidongia dinghuensis]GGF07324.1 hypothetical protein GCM10011611_10960 [Aliidongia dinghuensis]
MSAEIIAFPLKTPSCIDQQRWIPAPRPRQPEPMPVSGYLHLFGFLVVAVSSWFLIAGTVRRAASLLHC